MGMRFCIWIGFETGKGIFLNSDCSDFVLGHEVMAENYHEGIGKEN